MHGQIYAGFAKVDITPQLDDPPPFEIFDPIFFRALHLRQGGRDITFLAADLFALDEEFRQRVGEKLVGPAVAPAWVLGGACARVSEWVAIWLQRKRTVSKIYGSCMVAERRWESPR